MEHLDVLIVGAGLSGICAAYHLQASCPGRTYAILEGRESLGGTWDLFRYPGIRSDSDMYTLGFSFRPWRDAKAIADGSSILAYLQETAETYGIDEHIRFRHKVERASWSSRDARWTVEARDAASGEVARFTCNFLFMCAGYYDYESGYTPDFPGVEQFRGQVVHPQKWPEGLDYEGKRVVIVGSGATAVTLVPEMAKRAAHVTMLQRSPTYIVARPARDPLADWMRERMSAESAYAITRWKNVLLGMAFYAYCRNRPESAKKILVGQVRRQLQGKADVDAHFTPSYNPWDQRVCLVPDGDLFRTIRRGKATVVTDHIDSFVENGIRLRSGQTLEADIVVTATGLNLKFLGGLDIEVDGRRFAPADVMTYKGMMLSDVPNMAFAIGYTNASWTLKCELTSEYVCRLLNHMAEHRHAVCVPRRDPSVKEEPILRFTSGYVQRSLDKFPRQGAIAPWKLYQNYVIDKTLLRFTSVADPSMEFSGAVVVEGSGVPLPSPRSPRAPHRLRSSRDG